MAFYVLDYSYVPDILERRDAHRGAHLELLKAAHQRGELVMAGALADPVDRGLLVWSVDDPAVVEAFVDHDPYVAAGLVSSWSLRPWTVSVGGPPAG